MAAKIRLKAIDRQVMVSVGATSGIGLATARLAATRGARLVLAGRSQDALRPSLEIYVRPVTDAHFYERDAGIYMRWAKKPYGPWSEPITIFSPFTAGQGGY